MRELKTTAWRRIRRLRVGWPALALMALGWLWGGLQLGSGGVFHGLLGAAVSFAALWLVLVLLLMAAWDLFVAFDENPEIPSLGFGRQRFPAWLQLWLVPAAFLMGLLLGHRYWQ